MNRAALASTLAICVGVGCGGSEFDGVPASSGPTYLGDVAPILARRCVSCHRKGGIGPFALETYQQVMALSEIVSNVVANRVMPPFPPEQDNDCPRIEDPRAMPEQERERIAQWIATGREKGSDGPAPTLPENPMGEPTDEWPMNEPYTPDANHADDYRCFVIDPHNAEYLPVSAVSVKPGNRTIVHHAAVFIAPPEETSALLALDDGEPGPGYKCFGGIGVSNAYPAGLWVPGNDAPLEPPHMGVGYYLPPGWVFVLQNHYSFLHGSGEDLSTVQLWRAGAITEVPHALAIGDFAFVIPAGAKSVVGGATGEFIAKGLVPTYPQGNEGAIYSVWGHEHLLGTSFRMDLLRADGKKECLLHIPKWDFHYQSIYRLDRLVPAYAGDKLLVECEWDNSPENQPMIHGKQGDPKVVTFGENSTDEMCLGSIGMVEL